MIKTIRSLLEKVYSKQYLFHSKCIYQLVPARTYSTSHERPELAPAPRNLFELYSRNSNWLGLCDRHPIIKIKITSQEFKEKVRKEKEKDIAVKLPLFIDPKNAIYTPKSKRVGAIGRKLGMSVMWTREGFRHAVSLIQIKDCHVIDTQISRQDGGIDEITQMMIGVDDIADQDYLAKISRAKMEWYDQRGVFPKQFWTGFPVTKDSLLFPGTEITASHFVAGQYINIQGITIDRGMQGVMQRWGMKGQPASHGQTKTHRKMGATGGGTDPGRIFPGKKMAGHVGKRYKTTPPLKIFRINTKHNIIFVKGPIPGEVGGFLKLQDGRNRTFPNKQAPPFPTHVTDRDDILDEDCYADNVCKPSSDSLTFSPFK